MAVGSVLPTPRRVIFLRFKKVSDAKKADKVTAEILSKLSATDQDITAFRRLLIANGCVIPDRLPNNQLKDLLSSTSDAKTFEKKAKKMKVAFPPTLFDPTNTNPFVGLNKLWNECPMENAGLKRFLMDSKLGFVFNNGKFSGASWKTSLEESRTEDGEIVFMLHVKCGNDSTTIRSGRKYGAPRGFKIVYVPVEDKIDIHGFKPKFGNDPNRQEAVSVPANAHSLSFFKKYSGYLGMLFTISVNGTAYFIATSKNSATNFFAEDAIRLWMKFVTPELCAKMEANNLTICAEMMSYYDQCHGAALNSESPMVTVVSTGLRLVAGRTSFSVDPRNAKNVNQHRISSPPMVDYMKNADVVAFCEKFGLPFGELFSISGNPPMVKKFAECLFQERDWLDNKSFDQLAKDCGVTIHPGSLTHEDVLGNVLEGIVVQFFDEDGNVIHIPDHSGEMMRDVKLKLIVYVIRTMVIRTVLSQAYSKVYMWTDEFVDFATKTIEDTVPKWIRADIPESSAFWKSFAHEVIRRCRQNGFVRSGKDEPTCDVQSHIVESDKLLAEIIRVHGSLQNAVMKGALFPPLEKSTTPQNDDFEESLYDDFCAGIDTDTTPRLSPEDQSHDPTEPTTFEWSFGGKVFHFIAKTLLTAPETFLYVVRGISGTGKTTLAFSLVAYLRSQGRKASVVSADDWFKKYQVPFDKKHLGRAHRYCQHRTRRLLREGHIVFVANTFLRQDEFAPYISMGVGVNIIEPVNVPTDRRSVNLPTDKAAYDEVIAAQKKAHVSIEKISLEEIIKPSASAYVAVVYDNLFHGFDLTGKHTTLAFGNKAPQIQTLLEFASHNGKTFSVQPYAVYEYNDDKGGYIKCLAVHGDNLPGRKPFYHVTLDCDGEILKPAFSNQLPALEKKGTAGLTVTPLACEPLVGRLQFCVTRREFN